MNDPEHAPTGTSALGPGIQFTIPSRRSQGERPTAASAELVVVDLIAQHNEQPHEELPGDRDLGLGTAAPMHEGEIGAFEVGIHAGGMRRGLPQDEAEERTALLGDVAEMMFV